MKIKICGITNLQDAQDAVALGADAIGFIFTPKSPRYITPDAAEEIAIKMPPFIKLVGVFVNQSKEEITQIATKAKIDLIQLHGNESPEFCLTLGHQVIKAITIADLTDIQDIGNYLGMVSAVLLDTKIEGKEGGTGICFDWGIALHAKEEFDIPLILAGGINQDNVQKAISLVNPYAVDVSSGVEDHPGKKDYNKMKAVIEIAQTY
jgi:phosphoribosylanthranilate isomerase